MRLSKEEKNLEFFINPERISYLLDLYKWDEEEFLEHLQGKNKNPILTIEQFNQVIKKKLKVKVGILNKIDDLFGKGIEWYVSKRSLPPRNELSIFFRKDDFNAELDASSKRKINEYEKKKQDIQNLARNINYNQKRLFSFTASDNPKSVAEEVLSVFSQNRNKLKKSSLLKSEDSDRNYLENLIRLIEECNVFVFEFTENWNVKNKATFNGFFMSPNIIVIKRLQNYLKREIFTLMHEFAHYLLDEEQIDDVIFEGESTNQSEKWCNEFAYYFLAGDSDSEICALPIAEEKNNFLDEELNALSQRTRLSKLALYTRLKIINKISERNYKIIKQNVIVTVNNEIERQKKVAKIQRDILKESGQIPFASSPKPIESNLFKELIRINYFEGKISQSEVLSNIGKKNKTFDEVLYS